jgi:hypothetical protein
MIRKALTIFFGIFSCNFKPTVVQTSITSVKIARNKNKTKAAGKKWPKPKGGNGFGSQEATEAVGLIQMDQTLGPTARMRIQMNQS